MGRFYTSSSQTSKFLCAEAEKCCKGYETTKARFLLINDVGFTCWEVVDGKQTYILFIASSNATVKSK